MKRFAFALLAALIALPAAAQTRTTIDTGTLEGVDAGDVVAFKNIPYIASPVGPLRWQPPHAPAKWSGVRKADIFGPACPQGRFPGAPAITTSEDCVTLNVWRPAKPGKYPVILWFFGGGFVGGDSSFVDGSAFAKRGIILVAANHRFGALGYMAHPALSATSPRGISANYGLLDQIAALQWIQRNIGRFGGDPANVTIAGQSSGGVSVDMLMATPMARGLFQRAIVQSAPITGLTPPVPTLEEAEAFGAAFTAARGANTLNEIYALTPEQLTDLSAGERLLASPFRPTIDGYVLPSHPLRLFATGSAAPVPLMIGSTAHESARITPLDAKPEAFEAWVVRTYPAQAQMILDTYPYKSADPLVTREAWMAVKSDDIFSGNRRMARFHSRNGNKVFLYRFDREPPGPQQPQMRSNHGADVAYMFDRLDLKLPYTEGDRALSELMVGYWSSFAKSGDPNGAGRPVWAPYAAGDEHELAFDLETRMVPVANKARLAIFETPVIR